MKWIRHSILVRMLLIILLAVMPLYAIGFSLYGAGSDQLMAETLNAKLSQMEYYMESMQRELTRLTLLQSTLINSAEIGTVVNRSAFLSNYAWSQRVNRLREELTAIRYSSQYVDTVTAYLLSNEKKLNDLRGLEVMNVSDKALTMELSKGRSNFAYVDGVLYVVASMRDSAKKPVYTVATRLLMKALSEDISRLDSAIPSDSALVYRPTNEAMAISSPRADALWTAIEPKEETQAYEVSGEITRQNLNGEMYRIARVDAPALNMRLYNMTREQDLRAVTRRYTPFLVALLLATALLISVLLPSISNMVHRPLHRLLDAFECVEKGDMKVAITHHGSDEFNRVFMGFNHMVETLDWTINKSLRQELLLKRAELVQLQSQINPHFLYNSYFLLHRMIKRRDWENAELFSHYMGGYFQYITRGARQTVTLGQEANHARLYAQIQAMRFGERIAVEFGDVPQACEGLLVPRLILQPVLENTFEHGLREKIDNGLVRVGFVQAGEGCDISVEDNGEDLSESDIVALNASLDQQDAGEVTALRNIHKRLRGALPAGSGLRLTRARQGGLCVIISITGGASDEPVDR